MTAMNWNAIAITPRDGVAVLLRDIGPGDTVSIRIDGRIVNLVAAGAIPLGHKIALGPLAAGSPVIKYGEVIGTTACDIAKGEHVHVHNVVSNRAKLRPT